MGDLSRSPLRIGKLFEGCAHSVIHNLKAFFLPTHGEQIGGFAR
ncbi:hypothetical protein ACFKHW_05365 [Bradyrhizobium lupini]